MNRSQDAALGTGHLVALAAGGVIGLGVMSMPGIGIGIIGTGLWIAALVGLGFSVIALVPQLLSTAQVNTLVANISSCAIPWGDMWAE